MVPDPSRIQPILSKALSPATAAYCSMAGRTLLYPNEHGDAVMVFDTELVKSLGSLICAGIYDAVLNPAGDLAATISVGLGPDGAPQTRVKIWSLSSFLSTTELSTPSRLSACLLKNRLLAGREDGTIKVWNVASSPIIDLVGHSGRVNAIVASDTENVALSGSQGSWPRLWDLRSGACVRTLQGHNGPVRCVDMDSACRIGLSGSADETVKVWDLGSGRSMETIKVQDQSVRNVVIHESGHTYLILEEDKTLSVQAVGCPRPVMRTDMRDAWELEMGHVWSGNGAMVARRDLSCIIPRYNFQLTV